MYIHNAQMYKHFMCMTIYIIYRLQSIQGFNPNKIGLYCNENWIKVMRIILLYKNDSVFIANCLRNIVLPGVLIIFTDHGY